MPRLFSPRRIVCLSALLVSAFALAPSGSAEDAATKESNDRLVLRGESGPGESLKVVLVSGDEEYRSEEALTQLANILAKRHGFDCTVLYAIDEDGTINPERTDNIPGLESLADADLLILFTRFRNLPEPQMKAFDEYFKSGRPILALRTATHAFNIKSADSPYRHYDWQSKAWEGGFGKQILGETWYTHHGRHGSQSTMGLVTDKGAQSPYLTGVKPGSIYGPTDVYGVRDLPEGTEVLVQGQILTGMSPTDPPLEGDKNNPMMPLIWVKPYQMPEGQPGTAFVTTMGASQDLLSEGFRRVLVNAVYILTGREDRLTPDANVNLVEPYHPRPFKFGGHRRGVRPAEVIGSQPDETTAQQAK